MTIQTVNLTNFIGNEVLFVNDYEQHSGVITSVLAGRTIFDNAGLGEGSELDLAVAELAIPPELLAEYFDELGISNVSIESLIGFYFLDAASGIEGVVTTCNAASGSINIDVTDIAPDPDVPYTPDPPPAYRPKPDGDKTPKWMWDHYENSGRSS